MWLCILTDKQFEETYENAQWIKARQMQAMWLCILPSNILRIRLKTHNATNDIGNVTMPFPFTEMYYNLCDFASSRANNLRTHLKTHTGEKSNKCNQCDNVMQAIWGYIWKCTVEKSQTNATNVTMHRLIQALWGDIWKHTVEKSQINATNVTMHPLMQAIWGYIRKCTVEKSQTNATNATMPLLGQAIRGHNLRCTVHCSGEK